MEKYECPVCKQLISYTLLTQASEHTEGYMLCSECLSVLRLEGGNIKRVEFEEGSGPATETGEMIVKAITKHLEFRTAIEQAKAKQRAERSKLAKIAARNRSPL